MNKIIKVDRWNISDSDKKSIKMIVDQMEKHNFAICSNSNAVKFFSRSTPEIYKRNETIMISRTSRRPLKSILVLKPEYTIERIDDFSFRIKMKR